MQAYIQKEENSLSCTATITYCNNPSAITLCFQVYVQPVSHLYRQKAIRETSFHAVAMKQG